MSINNLIQKSMNALIFIGVAFFAMVLIITVFHGVFGRKYEQENLYKEGSLPELLSRELAVIAPGQLIYVVHREDQRPAFPNDLKNPDRKDLSFLLNKNSDWSGPGHIKGGVLNAYVDGQISVKNNACVINIKPGNMDKSAKFLNINTGFQLLRVLAHETIHCGQAIEMNKLSRNFQKAIESAKSEIASDEDFDTIMGKSRSVFAESFVGAYFLSNFKHPGQSGLLDAIAKDAWLYELKQSQWRGYAHTFAAIAQRCEKADSCPAKLDELNALLIEDPAVMRAVVRDALAIVKGSQQVAHAHAK